MNNELFFTLVIVCILTHIIRLVYEILKHEKILIPGKKSLILMWINMTALWTSWFISCTMNPNPIILPDIIKYAGFILFLAGFIIAVWGLFTIKAVENYEGDLVTGGIYSKIRHPMYLGFILWLIGYPVFYGALYSLILGIIFSANVLFWRYLEEKELVKRFPSYIDYKKRTIF